MKTLTFIFIVEGHASQVAVTAETEKDCKEKYFLKYPERLGSPDLDILEGNGDELDFNLIPK